MQLRIIILLFLFAGCTTEAEMDTLPNSEQNDSTVFSDLMAQIDAMQAEPSVTTFVLIDLSLSTGNGDTDRAIKGFLNRMKDKFTKPGDQIVVIPITAGSADPRNSYMFEIRTEYPTLESKHASSTKLRILAGCIADIKKERKGILRHVVQTHFKAPANAAYTHILSALTHIDKHMMQRSEDQRIYRILAFTDGVEDSDIRKLKIASLEYARSAAKVDVVTLKTRFNTSDETFSRLSEIVFQLPRDNKSSESNSTSVYLPEYWNTVFQEMGSQVSVTFTGDVF